MKYLLIFNGLLLVIMLHGQPFLKDSLVCRYSGKVDSSGFTVKLNLFARNKFELIIDNIYDCTPAYVQYGKGIYHVKEDKFLLLNFDFIVHLPYPLHHFSGIESNEYFSAIKMIFPLPTPCSIEIFERIFKKENCP
ncbi:hypothetical protein [Haliscomenobacter hydrossis]|uniref:Uncharacterized protein n=1 Tax=Haliscomenobacter hydrossis (strain ATCC 27775 / DSM 1100 / LMG 10767 / O) TaxID=760192 RepID=F4KY19_HALH1|nr:hypothetical protein [Haliscomenobacter hydrossis]AEE53644.1 hypothetical protein Halhy_5821 [Haliscomenobacter hydrossis DSM 1100]